MVEVGVARAFHARHRLPMPDGSLHDDGHDYRAEVIARGERVPEDGMLLDLDLLAAAVGGAVGPLDGGQLDVLAAFEARPTTVEVVAEHLWREVAGRLASLPALDSIRVTLFESPDAWATIDRVLER